MNTNDSHDDAIPDPEPEADPDAQGNSGEPTLPTTTPAHPNRSGAPYASAARRPHGSGLRGANLSRQSPQFEGRFGRMFRTLPAAFHDEEDLKALARRMVAEREDTVTPETEPDNEENPGISAGYTYFGQFVDHDLTFDPASSLQRQNDPDGLVDVRTPRFDLDSIYGRGPDDQPYLYAPGGVRMLLGRPMTGSASDPDGVRDLPRNTPAEGGQSADADETPRRALIGDPRNDENVIVSQLQATMLRFHNRVADVLQERTGTAPRFETVQREVRFHYQWAILHDFLPTILGRNPVLELLPELENDGMRQGRWSIPANTDAAPILRFGGQNLRFYKPRNHPFMPVEFSVAAYRFGHSMIRPVYRLNTTLTGSDFEFPMDSAGRQGIFAHFDPAKPEESKQRNRESLVGLRQPPAAWAVDWNLFFPIGLNETFGPNRLQPSYKIDTSLVDPLSELPESIATGERSLAARNLLRGLSMGLPSGQAVARAMGIAPIPDSELRVGKATREAAKTNPLLTDISADFADNAPLWYYILAEAQHPFVTTPDEELDDTVTEVRLGPVGGRIIGETFVGLLLEDSHSYLRQHPAWQPFHEFVDSNRVFGIAEMIRAARG